jgi:hypothetical protein
MLRIRSWFPARTTKVAGFALATFVVFVSHVLAEPAISWVSDPVSKRPTRVELTGLSDAELNPLRTAQWDAARWQKLFSVHVGEKTNASDLPMLGTYRIEGAVVCFEPQFPLDATSTYRAELRPSQLPGAGRRGDDIIAIYRPPAHASEPTAVVTQIYPSAEIVPENLLKFYVHFSAPMSGGRIYDHIHLRNEAGKDVELPFLEIDEELWDPTMTRLTLFIDPGRIKRGVKPLEDVGAALEAGKKFALVIDRDWKDAGGNPLKQPFEKRFAVGAPDRTAPDPSQWKIAAPSAGSKGALTVNFAEPMDHALALRMISVHNATGAVVKGAATLEDQDRQWHFTPAEPWSAGEHQVIVTTTIEDLAGNNIGKLFDVDVNADGPREVTRQTVRLPVPIR